MNYKILNDYGAAIDEELSFSQGQGVLVSKKNNYILLKQYNNSMASTH